MDNRVNANRRGDNISLMQAEERLPILHPPPLHTFSVKAAQRLNIGCAEYPPFVVRCKTCLASRWCERCNVWWCEQCISLQPEKSSGDQEQGMTKATGLGNIKVHNGLCVSRCLMDDLLNGVGEGGMWG